MQRPFIIGGTMIWATCLYLSITILAASVIAACIFKKTKRNHLKPFTPFHLILSGVAISAFLLFIPICSQTFLTGRYRTWEVLLSSLYNVILLFLVNGDIQLFVDSAAYLPGNISELYIMFSITLVVIAPILTFGVVLSFFKNFLAYKDYIFAYFSDIYIFSGLNEESLALSKSLKQHDTKRKIIFTNVSDLGEDKDYTLMESAQEMDAILFKKDITSTQFDFHSKKKNIHIFLLEKDESKNINQTLSLLSKYKSRENISIYVFSTSINSELLLNTVDKGNIKLRRINSAYLFIQRLLYDTGISLFENGSAFKENEKLISAVILGMGKYGTEMTKALSWFCQMDGYRLQIHTYDIDEDSQSVFSANCPELMDEIHNGDFTTRGEAHYKISMHSGINAETKEFMNEIQSLKDISYIFVALGDDDKNIQTAVRLRSWLLKNGNTPQIDAVVHDSDKKEALQNITNHAGQNYDIHFVGDTNSIYSEEVILKSDIEAIALERHMKWGKEEDFWKYEYNYRSSMASAVHKKLKLLCHIPGIEKNAQDRTESELWGIRELEHRRWNAYMRSEGFTYAPQRNNLAKTHHCLVPFYDLPYQEQVKDDD